MRRETARKEAGKPPVNRAETVSKLPLGRLPEAAVEAFLRYGGG